MSLILRKDLARPLTHEELDGNLIYLNIKEWTKKNYLKGQYVFRKSGTSGLLYYCENSHTEKVYDDNFGNFTETYTDGSTTTRIWRQIGGTGGGGGGGGLDTFTLVGTIATITDDNAVTYSIDLNDVEIQSTQLGLGISNHSYQFMDSSSFISQSIDSATYYVAPVEYGATGNSVAKLNIIVVDLTTSIDNHHLIELPDDLTLNEAGIIYRIVVKRADICDLNKFLMVYSSGAGSGRAIMATNINTLYNGKYFLPLEGTESVDILWDGTDFLVTSENKRAYVSLNSENFVDMLLNPNYDTAYLNRDTSAC